MCDARAHAREALAAATAQATTDLTHPHASALVQAHMQRQLIAAEAAAQELIDWHAGTLALRCTPRVLRPALLRPRRMSRLRRIWCWLFK